LLDWIETNRWFHIEVEKDVDINWINNDEKIINLLKAYGAKSIFDHAESIDDYLIITGYIDSGLYTKYGYLNINEINNIDENTITIFKEWLSRIVDISKDIGNGIFDDRDLLEKTNNEGIIITEKLRNIIENNAITVKYNYIKMDSGYRKEVSRRNSVLTRLKARGMLLNLFRPNSKPKRSAAPPWKTILPRLSIFRKNL